MTESHAIGLVATLWALAMALALWPDPKRRQPGEEDE